MLSPSVSRKIATSGTQLSFSVESAVESSPPSFALTVISSAPPGTSMRSSRSICESAAVGSLSSVSGRLGPCALVIVGGSDEKTSRTARKKLALRCQCLRLWHLRASFFLAVLLVFSSLPPTITRAQGPNLPETEESDPTAALSQILRLERIEVPGGAELITVKAKLGGLDSTADSTENDNWVPLVVLC